ncbi:MAG TPA: MraY family glycosyltransferase [Steroidobacteraceae bacterium]|nr:MraY family glycosyltransferase [Steroidobacteraceae bacterium]
MAVAVELVDKPGGRKTHHGEIPVVGGLAMFVGCIFGVGLLPANQFISAPLLSAAALVVIVGLLDDRFEISPAARLTAHLVAALLVLGTSPDFSITTLGRPFGDTPVQFSELSGAAFTCVAIVGAINAFNMLDGMDGLAGTMAFNALLALTCLTSLTGDSVVGSMSIVLCGAVAAFLVFNIPAKFNRAFRCFMGDAGSTLLGFLLACMCISASQGEGSSLSPTTTLWVVAIPLYELLWTTIRRILKGGSPFQPDRAHFHHKLLDAGFGVRGAFFVLILIGILLSMVAIGIHYFEVSDGVSFAMWLLSGLGMIVLMHNARILWVVVPHHLRRQRTTEVDVEAA